MRPADELLIVSLPLAGLCRMMGFVIKQLSSLFLLSFSLSRPLIGAVLQMEQKHETAGNSSYGYPAVVKLYNVSLFQSMISLQSTYICHQSDRPPEPSPSNSLVSN
jgi:hypothetical protein